MCCCLTWYTLSNRMFLRRSIPGNHSVSRSKALVFAMPWWLSLIPQPLRVLLWPLSRVEELYCSCPSMLHWVLSSLVASADLWLFLLGSFYWLSLMINPWPCCIFLAGTQHATVVSTVTLNVLLVLISGLFMIPPSGLWSVTTVKRAPNRYMWKCSQTHTTAKASRLVLL